MDNLYWILWCILGAILIVAEVFTSGFVLLWFGIGALAAAFAGIIGVSNLGVQFLIFAFVSIGLTAASRTIFVNYFSREKTGDSLRTGVDSLPGKFSGLRGQLTLLKVSRLWKPANACAWKALKARQFMCAGSMKELTGARKNCRKMLQQMNTDKGGLDFPFLNFHFSFSSRV